jgi:hypothetical protein
MLERVEEDLEHWRAKGPVGKLHNIVKFIRASPQRTEAFKVHAREQEEADIYKLAPPIWEFYEKSNIVT